MNNVKDMKKREEVFRLRSEGRTLQEIGDMFGITRERVRQLLSVTYARRRDLKEKYGITLEDYEEMLKSQGGRCLICKEKPVGSRLCVDHSHKTKKVRGLLCTRCNSGIGHMRDSVEILESAIKYLNLYMEV